MEKFAINSTLEKIIWLLLTSVFILPFLVATSFYFPFITPRNFIFRIIVGIALGLTCYLFLSHTTRFRIRENRMLMSFVVLIVVLTLSSILNGDFRYSFWSTYERMEGLINYYYLLVFLVLLLFFIRTRDMWEKLIRFTLFISYLIAAVAWWQSAGIRFLVESAGGERVSSMLGNATYLATYALFHIFFALYMLLKRTHNLRFEGMLFIGLSILMLATEYIVGAIRTMFENGIIAFLFFFPLALIAVNQFKHISADLYFIFLIIINFFAMFNTQTRGALVGFIIGVLAMLIATPFFIGSKTVKKNTIFGLLLCIGLLVGIFSFNDSPFIKNNATLRRLTTIFNLEDTTTKARFLTWETVWKGFKEKPILGWGEERFLEVFNKNFPTEIYRHANSRIWYDRPHNIFLQPLTHGGILGFAAYLGIYFFAFQALIKVFKRSNDLPFFIVFGGLIIAYMIQNAFVFDSINSYILFILLLGYLIFRDEEVREGVSVNDERSQFQKQLPQTTPIVGYIAVFIIFFTTYVLSVPQALANRSYTMALQEFTSAVSSKNTETALTSAKKLQEITGKHYLGQFELRHTFSEAVAGMVRQRALPKETTLEIGKIAIEELKKNIDAQPYNVRHHAFLLQLQMDMGELDPFYAIENLKLAEKAIALSPTRTHFYYSLGRANLVRQSYGEAIANFEKALELSPRVFDAHLNYMVGLALSQPKAENVNRAFEYIPRIEGFLGRPLSTEEWGSVAELFQFVGDVDKAIDVLTRAIVRYPEAPELYKQLAVYYASKGDKIKAMETMDKVLALDPSFQDEYDVFKEHIDELKRTQ